MEIQQEFFIPQQSAAGDVPVAEDHVPPRVLGGVGANQRKQLRPVRQVAIVAIHDLDLAEVNRLHAQIDVGGGLIVKPEFCLDPTDVGYGAVSAPVAPLTSRIDHLGVSEIAFLHRLPERTKDPIRHGNLLHLRSDNFKHAGLQNHFRVSLVNLWRLLAGSLEVRQEIRLATPQAQAAANELGPSVPEHPNVVIQITAAIEQTLHADGAGEIIFENLA